MVRRQPDPSDTGLQFSSSAIFFVRMPLSLRSSVNSTSTAPSPVLMASAPWPARRPAWPGRRAQGRSWTPPPHREPARDAADLDSTTVPQRQAAAADGDNVELHKQGADRV